MINRTLVALGALLLGCRGGEGEDKSADAGSAADTGEACTWCVDTGAIDDGEGDDDKDDDGKGDDGKGDDGKGDDGKGDGADGSLYWMAGELDAGTALGVLSFGLADATLEPVCSVPYAVVSAVETDDCAECDAAFVLLLAEEGAHTGDVDCSALSGLAGVEVDVGHAEGGTVVYAGKGGGWGTQEGATSTIEDGQWSFFYVF